MIEAYPLQWPAGFSRTKHPKRAPFRSTIWKSGRNETILTNYKGVQQVENEVRRLIGKKELSSGDLIISTNIPTRKDGGGFYSNSREPEDSGVAVYFKLEGEYRVIACDAWDKVMFNLHAIAMTVGAMRGIDRWGASDVLARAFTGFGALPPPESKSWRGVLQIDALETTTVADVKQAYRMLVKLRHPDAGGTDEAMHELRRAYEEAMAELGGEV